MGYCILICITIGITNTTFEPDSNIEHQQMAVFFSRFLNSLDVVLPVVNTPRFK